MSATLPDSGLSRAARYAVPFVLLLIPLWTIRVNAVIPKPYLDEVFHVPQAQAYWAHKWTQWDPKITTPPGLYLWSYILCACVLALRGDPTELTTEVLRFTNVGAASVFIPWRLQTLLDSLRKERNNRPASAWLSHTVLNICLFPPLFFFSGLYYTDILALLVVVEAYNWQIRRNTGKRLASLGLLVLGLVALAFRQTNIFWAAAFLGGLQVVRTVRQASNPCESTDIVDIVKKGLQNELYDPFVSSASVADYFKASVSLAAASLSNFSSVLTSVIPHLLILAGFGAFVAWNNGVVLGHKEFHTAGLHLSQMLYIWPYFVFFSWPLLLGPVINLLVPSAYLPKFLDYGFPKQQKGLPRLFTMLAVLPVMLAVVHFNTVVHPFTLADNRHYVFYAFRILRSHPAVKYAATLVYFYCGWAVISAFGTSTIAPPPKFVRSMAASSKQPTQKEQKKETKKPKRDRRSATAKKASKAPESEPLSPEVFARIQEHIAQRQKLEGPPRVSFVIVWLVATSLSLITAPLVEPRYFIIPWVMWRLHVPPPPIPAVYRQQRPEDPVEVIRSNLATYFPQFLETLWFLAINVVTVYVFLYKGFEWPQEPGKIQRFMW